MKPEGDKLKQSVRDALKENVVTKELGGSNATVEVGDWVAQRAMTLKCPIKLK
jgi:isocitrate/isopropylmalate dehydrogenase